ncbi:MAG: hypothetical protein JEY96_19215 [Bacteroidales bacterium]|nr:hypothetical protein [Bacteroidales bacterium]
MQESSKKKAKIIRIIGLSILALLIIHFNFHFIKGIKKAKNYGMTFVRDQESRYDWLLNKENISHSDKVYSIGRVDDKYLYVYELNEKYLLYIYEIEEYENIQISNIGIALSEKLKENEIGISGSGSWHSLTFTSKLDKIEANKLTLFFSENSTASIIDKNSLSIQFKTVLDKLVIKNEQGEYQFEIFHEKKAIPTNFLFFKGNDSFFIISIFAKDNSVLEDSIIQKLLNF